MQSDHITKPKFCSGKAAISNNKKKKKTKTKKLLALDRLKTWDQYVNKYNIYKTIHTFPMMEDGNLSHRYLSLCLLDEQGPPQHKGGSRRPPQAILVLPQY